MSGGVGIPLPGEQPSRPKRRLGIMRYALESVERAQAEESRHVKSYGGHRHFEGHPLLTMPLPSGRRKP